jgi:SAM-dependent methyltransferase
MKKSAAGTEVAEMLQINEAQKAYYEAADGTSEAEVNGFATNLWRRLRGRALSVYDPREMDNSLADVHLQWLGNELPKMKVLDLGVGYGNPLSMYLARNARQYVAIDLSQTMVDWFQKQLDGASLTTARAMVADVLSDQFPERDFDLVYARAVFHHFGHFDAFLQKLSNRMTPGGKVITLDDPLETWLPMKLLRLAYRPFQTDADWEYPFNRASLRSIEKHFVVEKVQGTYGHSKWAIPLGFIAPAAGKRKAREWHARDLGTSYDLRNVRSCLRASMLLRKR